MTETGQLSSTPTHHVVYYEEYNVRCSLFFPTEDDEYDDDNHDQQKNRQSHQRSLEARYRTAARELASSRLMFGFDWGDSSSSSHATKALLYVLECGVFAQLTPTTRCGRLRPVPYDDKTCSCRRRAKASVRARSCLDFRIGISPAVTTK